MGIMASEGRMHETCRGQKEYLHTQGALALVDSEVRQRRDSFARWGDASPNRMQWSTVAQRNAQSKSAVSLVAVVEAQEGSWATERPLTSAGQSSEQRMVIHWGHDGPRRVVEGGSRREGCCCVRACLLACLLACRANCGETSCELLGGRDAGVECIDVRDGCCRRRGQQAGLEATILKALSCDATSTMYHDRESKAPGQLDHVNVTHSRFGSIYAFVRNWFWCLAVAPSSSSFLLLPLLPRPHPIPRLSLPPVSPWTRVSHQTQKKHIMDMDMDLDLDFYAADPSRWSRAVSMRKATAVLHYAYPIFMLFFFLAAFTVRSIAASNSNANIAKPTTTGPGGKPLPATDPTRNFVKRTAHDDVTHTQKRVFEWLSLAAALTFIANSVLVISHSLVAHDENWWAGKSVVVRTPTIDT